MSAETTWAKPSADLASHTKDRPAAPKTDSLSLLWRLLERAKQRVAPTCADVDAASAEHVELLSCAIRQASGGEVPNLGTLPSYAPARGLLDALRTEFIEEAVASGDGATGALTILRGFERVREALERDSAQRLASRFSGPDALEMIVAVAHDMRSPLTSVLFLVDILRNARSGPITAHQERQLLLVYGAVFGLSALVSDLIDLARGGDRLMDTSPVPFSLSECLHAVSDIVQPIAEEKKLEIQLQSPTKADRRLGQPAALTRVLLNLATNALKFTNQGSVRVFVTELSRTRLHFAVSDTGRGIPPHVLESLFDAFRRPPRSRGYVFSSAGLGLSICQKLVSAMGGTLNVTSDPGVETCFSFELDLPLAPRL